MSTPYRIQILDSAIRDLKRLDKPVAKRILGRIEWLAEHIEAAKPEPLADDLSGLYKYRVGQYRVIYEILHNEKMLFIHLIGHRRDIYRKR